MYAIAQKDNFIHNTFTAKIFSLKAVFLASLSGNNASLVARQGNQKYGQWTKNLAVKVL